MKRATATRGFALVVTLVLMALIVIVVVAYLGNTQSDRSTSSTYSNRLRAKMMADTALTAATKLLYDNTKNGNYITAMPAPSPSPAPLRTELYRPDSTTIPDDFLQLNNAIGEVLASRVSSAALAAPTPQVDPRPPSTIMAAPATGGSFGLVEPNPTPSSADSFDFNQVVRVGSTDGGRLVSAITPVQPAFGQWVRVRNSAGELIGRYAFFIEDESMKINVNVVGNKLGSGQSNLRFNDLSSPPPTSTPAQQAEEIDPSGALPASANKPAATKALVDLGNSGGRVATKDTVGLLSDWDGANAKLSDYGQTLTSLSNADVTTARGWQRMDLNDVVANNDSKTAAKKIANWIQDAWTGPTQISALQSYQMFNDERMRLQIAANIVDYIDADNIPTNAGNVPNDPSGYPVLGIEKIPYLVELDVIYQATGATPDTGHASISMKFRLNFMNMFETDLLLGTYVGKITVKGVPSIDKNGAVFDHENVLYEIPVGGSNGIPNGVVPWGGDNSANGIAGVKTFYTPNVLTEDFDYPPGGSPTQFEAGLLEINVYGPKGDLLDSAKVSLRPLQAKYSNATPQPSPNDFLSARQSAASMNATYGAVASQPSGSITQLSFGDPRYRPAIITQRLYNVTRTDITRYTPPIPNTTVGDDKADMDARAYSVDWYDYLGNRPLLFHRNGPLVSIGELGNVSACEYPWRTLYLQYAGRSNNTNDPNIIPEIQKRRGSLPAAATDPSLLPFDYVLMDLFKTSAPNTASGVLNINTQYNVSTQQGALAALLTGLPADQQSLTSTAAINALAFAISQRRNAVAASTSGGPGPASGSPPIDNNPRRPYFTIGQLASDLSWLINQSENSTTNGNGRSRTTTNYSVLRTTPTTKSQWTRNYGSDMQVEEPYRKLSNSITTHGNVFRVLYVGQAIKDINKDGKVQTSEDDPAYKGPSEKFAEYLGEAYIERDAVFGTATTVGASSVIKTTDSKLRILAQHPISE